LSVLISDLVALLVELGYYGNSPRPTEPFVLNFGNFPTGKKLLSTPKRNRLEIAGRSPKRPFVAVLAVWWQFCLLIPQLELRYQ
jgi:hypothetical protein